jgi:hypothetical protein
MAIPSKNGLVDSISKEFMLIKKTQSSFFRLLYLYCTRPDLRKKAKERRKLNAKAYRARATFVGRHPDDDYRYASDSDPIIFGSSAWLIDHEMTSAFSSSSLFDHDAFMSSLQRFDTTPNIFDNSFGSSSDPFGPLSDWVTGGTDSTGCHGISGHHDGFPSSSPIVDSFSSRDPFA